MRSASASRWARAREALTPAEWRRVVLLASVVLGLHAAGFFLLFVVVAPRADDGWPVLGRRARSKHTKTYTRRKRRAP